MKTSFEQRTENFLTKRNQAITRAAHFSPNVTAISFEGRGNRISFIYDPLKVRIMTNYAGECDCDIKIIEDSAFMPGIIDFNDALKLAKRMFVPFDYKNNAYYPSPEVTQDVKAVSWKDHPRKEKDKLYGLTYFKQKDKK